MIYLPKCIQNIIYEYDPTYKLFVWQKNMEYIRDSCIHCDCEFVSFIHIIKYKKQLHQYTCPNCYMDWYV